MPNAPYSSRYKLSSPVSFIGFDQGQYGLITNQVYTYDNTIECFHGYGYHLYKNGTRALSVKSKSPFHESNALCRGANF